MTKVTAANCRWESRQVLVPRSKLAAAIHAGKVSVDELAARQDERSRPLRDELQQALAQRDAAVRDLEQQAARQQDAARAEYERRAAQFDQHVAAQEQQAQRLIAQWEERTARDVATEEARCRQRMGQIREEHEPQIAAQREQVERESAAYRGPGGLLRGEGLAAAVVLPVGLGVGWGLTLVDGPLPLAGWQLAALGAALGAGCGGVVGGLLRQGRLGRIRQPLVECEAARDRAGRAEAQQSQKRIAELRAQADRGTHSARQFLQQAKDRRTHDRDAHEQQVSHIRAHAAAAVTRTRQLADQQIDGVRRRLLALYQPRPSSAAKDFPLYRSALSQGYREGTDPPDREAQAAMSREWDKLLAALSEHDRLTLALAAKLMSKDDFNHILEELSTCSRSERAEQLSRLFRTLVHV
jgi:hypothetical protein